MKPHRIAVIGTGRWGSNIIRTLRTIPRCEVAYSATRDYARLLKQDDIDAVVIATPAATHTKIASAFIRKGLPVFIEKPFASTLADAKSLAALARKHRVSVFVGHIHLYNPAYLAIKKQLPMVGAVRMIIAEAGGPGPVRKDANALWDWAPHDVAAILDIVGRDPVSIEAQGNDDTVFIRLAFTNDITAIVYNSRVLPKKCKRLTVIGTTGMIAFDDLVKKKRSAEPPLTAELRAWLGTLGTRKKFPSDLAEGLAVMRVLDAAARSLKES